MIDWRTSPICQTVPIERISCRLQSQWLSLPVGIPIPPFRIVAISIATFSAAVTNAISRWVKPCVPTPGVSKQTGDRQFRKSENARDGMPQDMPGHTLETCASAHPVQHLDDANKMTLALVGGGTKGEPQCCGTCSITSSAALPITRI